MKELTVDALTEKTPEVLAFVESELEAAEYSLDAKLQLLIAVEEIYVNIAHYAYAPGTGTSTIYLDISDGAATITFTDSGMKYDPLAKPDPDINLPIKQRKKGGLGIFMVKNSMDDMFYEYKNGKNVLTIKKKITGEA